MNKNKPLCIAEWQVFGIDDIKAVMAENNSEKAQKIFDELKNFADEKSNHIFLNSYGKNRLKARNYVGLIQTKSGFCLEILPKTFRLANENEGFKKHQDKINEAKDLLLKMLQTLKNLPFKQSHIANLKTQNAPLLEIFVMMFLNEVEMLIKKGLKSNYLESEQNRKFLKGRLLFSQNLKHNFAHKERFFTASDEFTPNIAPNKLIKSTLLLLSTNHFSVKTNARIAQSRFIFNEIIPSQNYDKDFAKCENLRHFKDYELLLLWCKIFLKKQTFTAYQGNEKAFALLFDMNELFESFVAWHLQKYIAQKTEKIKIKTQDASKYLMEYKVEKNKLKDSFQLIPDIVCQKNDKNDKIIFIADTKWKILNNEKDIQQNDLYQIWAYLTKYECQKAYLIYPKTNKKHLIKIKKFFYKAYKKEGNFQFQLKVHFFNLNKFLDK